VALIKRGPDQCTDIHRIVVVTGRESDALVNYSAEHPQMQSSKIFSLGQKKTRKNGSFKVENNQCAISN